jgi:hypothetical protein
MGNTKRLFKGNETIQELMEQILFAYDLKCNLGYYTDPSPVERGINDIDKRDNDFKLKLKNI